MEPKDFAQVVLRRKRTVITAVIIALVSVFFVSLRKDVTYVAACEVLFQATEFDITNPNASPAETVGTLESNKKIFTSPEIVLPVAESLKLDPRDVFGTLHVEIFPATQIFELRTVDAGLPHPIKGEKPEWITHPGQRAGDLCNAFAQEYVNFKKREARTVFESQLIGKEASLTARLREYGKLQNALDRAKNKRDAFSLEIRRNTLLSRISDLQGEITGLREQLDDGISGGGKIIAPAGEGVAQKPDLKRDLMMGAMVGLLFGFGIALVREYLDDTVKDKESTQRELGIPVLAALPLADELDGLDEPSTGTIEAARSLRTTLSSLGFPHEKSMLVMASSLAKKRATTLASLAAAVAESGRSVLVVGADLRGGRTHEAFGIHNSVGLANVVRGQVPFEKAIRPAPGLDGVYVMPCGPIIGNPGELLSSEAMAMTLRRARRWADVVLIDAPPVLAAADASILSAYADGSILVVAAGRTNRAQANEAKEQLIAAGGRVLGAVIVGADETARREINDDLDLGSFGDWGGYDGGSYGSYGSYDATDDGWFEDGVTNISVYAEDRPVYERRAPAKKVPASAPGQRPPRSREESVPRNGVKTTAKSRARGGRATGTKRTASKTPTARKPAAKTTTKRKPAAKKSATRKPAAKKTTTRTTTTRTSTAKKTTKKPTRKSTRGTTSKSSGTRRRR